MRENLEFDEEFAEDQEKDWKSIVFGTNKCSIIKAKDSAETLNESLLDDTEVYSDGFYFKLLRLILIWNYF